jgi:hypothetical protein
VTARVNSAEGGTNGTTVTTGNSGGTSGDAWDWVSIPTGTALTFATAAAYKGSLGYRFTQGTASGTGAYFRWNTTGWTSVRTRGYFSVSAYPSANAWLHHVTNSANYIIASVSLTTTGQIQVQDYNAKVVYKSAAAVGLNTDIRFELIVVPGTTASNGTIRFAWGVGDAAASDTFASTAADTGRTGVMDRCFFGKLSGTWNATIDFDDFAADDQSTTTFLGPSAASGTPVVVDPTPPPTVPTATWPPPPPFPEAIRSSLALTYLVSASYDGAPLPDATDMRPTGGTITDTNKPGVRRVLNLEVAGGHDLFANLAPFGTELTVTCRVTYNDRTTLTIPMGVFDIDSDSLVEGQGKITVTAPDKWVRIQRAKFLQPTASTIGQSVVQQIVDLIRGGLGADEPVTVTATSSANMGAITWEKDREKAINDLAAQIGAWVYFDRQGEATVADIPQGGLTARTWLVDASASGVMTDLTRQQSRTDTYNVVVVGSSSADSEKFPTQIVWDNNNLSPTYAGPDPLNSPGLAGPFGVVVDYLDSPNLGSVAEAQAAGLAQLARGLGLASQPSLGQVPNPAVDAFDAIDVLAPKENVGDSRVVERHVVDHVTHPLTVGPVQQIEGRQTRTDL